MEDEAAAASLVSALFTEPTLLANVKTAVRRNGWGVAQESSLSAAVVVTDLQQGDHLDFVRQFHRSRPTGRIVLYIPNQSQPESRANLAIAEGLVSALLVSRSATSDIARLRVHLRNELRAGFVEDVSALVEESLGIKTDSLKALVRAGAAVLVREWGNGGWVLPIARSLGVTPRQLERLCARATECYAPRAVAGTTVVLGVQYHAERLGISERRAAADLGISARRWLSAMARHERLRSQSGSVPPRNPPHPPRI